MEKDDARNVPMEKRDLSGMAHHEETPEELAVRMRGRVNAHPTPFLICSRHPIMWDESCSTCLEAKSRNEAHEKA
jgi:hypothetical protein